jgi:NTE family protein
MVLPHFVNRIRSAIDQEFRRSLYRNLVFSGGGVRGIAYLGAVEVLDEYRILDNIERVAGTSAGAITATLLSLRLRVAEMRELFLTLDFRKVPQSDTRHTKRRLISIPDEENPRRFLRSYGWYSSQYFYHWLQDIIAHQYGGNPKASFRDFRERGYRDLYIVAANVSRQRAEVFSPDHTPEVAVADAVRMSISIPLYFESLRFNGKRFGSGEYYVDGGLYDNFPVHIFDKEKFAGKPWAFRDGVNWETLGLLLYPEKARHLEEPEIPENVWDFLSLMLRNVYYSHELSSYRTSTVDQERTIEISDCGISPTDFDIEPGDETYQKLYQSGRNAVKAFFDPAF